CTKRQRRPAHDNKMNPELIRTVGTAALRRKHGAYRHQGLIAVGRAPCFAHIGPQYQQLENENEGAAKYPLNEQEHMVGVGNRGLFPSVSRGIGIAVVLASVVALASCNSVTTGGGNPNFDVTDKVRSIDTLPRYPQQAGT